MAVQELTPGFADPVRDSAVAFRAVLDAMARPGRVNELSVLPEPTAPLNGAATVLALSLLDGDTPVWIAESLRSAAVDAFVRFHTGAPIVDDPARARFAFCIAGDVLEMLEALPIGTPEYPDRSATLVVLVDGFDDPAGRRLTGPGIADRSYLNPAGVTSQDWAALSRNAALFPLGVDTIFAGPDRVAALPRSTRIHTTEG